MEILSIKKIIGDVEIHYNGREATYHTLTWSYMVAKLLNNDLEGIQFEDE